MDERTKQLLALGREHYENREYDKAEHYLRQVAERVQFADVQHMLGVIHHDRGRFEEAQSAFEEALRINPAYTEAALNLSVTYNDLGRYDDAKRVYQAALARRTDAPGHLDPYARGKIANLHGQVAQAYADAGLASEAMQELRKAVVLCPHFVDLRHRLANLCRQQGDLNGARFELEEAVRLKPSYVHGHVALGVILLSLGEVEGAKVAWQRAVDLDPGHRAAATYLRMAEVTLSSRPPAPRQAAELREDREPTEEDDVGGAEPEDVDPEGRRRKKLDDA